MENIKDYNFILEKNTKNIQNIDKLKVKRVLVLYEEKDFYLGDTCIRIDSLRDVKSFFKNARIDINCKNDAFVQAISAFLINNPNLDGFLNLQWENLSVESYDVVICLSHEEYGFLDFLYEKFGTNALEYPNSMAVVSLSKSFLKADLSKCVFPFYKEFLDYTDSKKNIRQLYVNEEERNWADNWLLFHGFKEDEHLCILIDSTANRNKLISITVYFEILAHLLENKKNRILIFDEKSIGKDEFYTAWLGEEKADRIIFAKGNSLREDLRILSSRYTKLILGPCTGLMHCASGIYNNLVDNGLSNSEVPLLITYTGTFTHAHHWWQNSPLITCLMLREHRSQMQMVELSELSIEEAERTDNQLPCSDYTSKMLIDVIYKKQPRICASHAILTDSQLKI